MRSLILALISALGFGVFAAEVAWSSPFTAVPAWRKANIVRVWGGCGWGFHPIPGHWSQWRGAWVPPHCVPNHYDGGWYGGGAYTSDGPYGYGGYGDNAGPGYGWYGYGRY